ncbi:hypothetical protein IE81DRAFT_366009 [Ceraceosorus guamensis]|uniref:Uncharacterized protein n=1 Tax=Ceraceosorus guamensis TaxID=1522189 RepID=A0A316W093_9BASI|nr:hypothetical protein IE81DRAFT_366009 [Ceraceosorus guamensis]PWN43200.1 hypothetical protein IE81DRAFT_366009 [Ceraceosorus guamensis]
MRSTLTQSSAKVVSKVPFEERDVGIGSMSEAVEAEKKRWQERGEGKRLRAALKAQKQRRRECGEVKRLEEAVSLEKEAARARRRKLEKGGRSPQKQAARARRRKTLHPLIVSAGPAKELEADGSADISSILPAVPSAVVPPPVSSLAAPEEDSMLVDASPGFMPMPAVSASVSASRSSPSSLPSLSSLRQEQ